jgi:hypothetical protein
MLQYLWKIGKYAPGSDAPDSASAPSPPSSKSSSSWF